LCDFWFHLLLQVSKSEIHKWLVSVNYNIPDQDYLQVQLEAEECFHKWCEEEEYIDSGKCCCSMSAIVFLTSVWQFFFNFLLILRI